MSPVHVTHGACPQTHAEVRLEMADMEDAAGRPMAAHGWRLIVARWRREFRQRGHAAGDPDGLVTPPEVAFWHADEETGVVCPCGHLSTHLCDEPMGRGMTCDLPLCRCCRSPRGDARDLCPAHAAREPMVMAL